MAARTRDAVQSGLYGGAASGQLHGLGLEYGGPSQHGFAALRLLGLRRQLPSAPQLSTLFCTMAELCIISGCDRIRFPSYINHRIFAETRGVAYRWSLFETKAGESSFFHKLQMARDTLREFEWVFW